MYHTYFHCVLQHAFGRKKKAVQFFRVFERTLTSERERLKEKESPLPPTSRPVKPVQREHSGEPW